MTKIFLNKEQKEYICNEMNPEGSNYKECNFFKVLEMTREGMKIEVGYWITYIGCNPIYKKEIRFFKFTN